MNPENSLKPIGCCTLLSFKPLLSELEEKLEHGSAGAKKLYSGIIAYAHEHPELLRTIDDLSKLEEHKEWVEMLLSIVFPPTISEHENLYCVGIPFSFTTIYTSRLFHMMFIEPGTMNIRIPDNATGQNIQRDMLAGAFHLILKKYCKHHTSDFISSVHPYHDRETGLLRYMVLQLDTRYVDVSFVGDTNPLTIDFMKSKNVSLMSLDELTHHIPIEKFIFEGLVIGRVIDVTEREVISQMKTELLSLNAFSENQVYHKLESHVQSLVGLTDIRIGITPFFKVNGHYVFSEIHNSNSLLFKHYKAVIEKEVISDCCHDLFIASEKPVVFETITQEMVEETEYLEFYYDQGYRSLLLAPLKHNNELWGVLEIGSEQAGKIRQHHVSKLDVAVPMFTLAIEKSAEALDSQIDKVIKEQFTAVQPSVEWKFTEAAYNYIIQKQNGKDPKPERIAFEEVFPLYGAIDIRNSSVERSQSIQLDFIEQLQKAGDVLKKAQQVMSFPLLQEIQFKIDKYISSASDVLQSEEETTIHDFLKEQVVSIFQHLKTTAPAVRKDIEAYFASLDPQMGMLYHHRKEYEESIAKINEAISKFLDKEQVTVQEVYPHYFERYVTDGVEFNIYIGQSLAPRKKFDELYLRNMKMWQLSTLAKAAKLSHELCKNISHPMKTTQLILAHGSPISISFRSAERKFDVDGAYNIRYEIVKKRIDKVHIKDSNERLTQPGKIAIVYSQPKEADEYMEYIEFLQNQKLLKPGPVEHYELEELQGVSGLKGLRVDVVYDEEKEPEVELSKVTTQQLVGK